MVSLFPAISAFAPIHGGEESQVFRFTSNGRKLILRLNRARDPFEKDSFAFQHFAKSGLPIPMVFQIGDWDHCFYCVSEEMPGQTLQDLHPERVSHLLLPTYKVWLAIAESDLAGLSGFGPFDSKGIANFSTWHSFLVDILDKLRDHEEEVQPYIDLEIVDKWANSFARLAAFCPEERALVHGDFGSNNILAENNSITGVVDWSEAMIGDPLYDIANIFFWRTWLTCMEQQASYFEANLPNISNCKERLLCYQLRIGLTELLASVLLKRDGAVHWSLERCRQIFLALSERSGR